MLLLVACSLLGGPAGEARAAPGDPPPATAEIELRKSFTRSRGRGRQPSRTAPVAPGVGSPAAGATAPGPAPLEAEAVARALGEPLAAAGALHLPLPSGGTVALAGDLAPVLETGTGRRVIIDAAGSIAPETAAEIERAWPGYAVARPDGGGLRELIAGVLQVAGYSSVDTSKPLVFGRGATVRVTPDFLIQRQAEDLLHGEVRALSVVDPADSLPAELRELAGEHRVRIVELSSDGSPAGSDVAPWRDPTGRVTTMETRRLAPLIAEIEAALGLQSGDGGELPPAGDAPAAGDPVRAAVGAMLARRGVPAVGPVVELYRPSAAGPRGRFVITIPGWLAERGGRRLLITGASPPLPLRLYLTRQGIDIFEYRLR